MLNNFVSDLLKDNIISNKKYVNWYLKFMRHIFFFEFENFFFCNFVIPNIDHIKGVKYACK